MTFHLVVSSLEEYKQLLVGRLISPTDLSLTEIAATGKSTVRVFKYGLMVLGMKVSGKMIKPMAKELWSTLTEMSTKGHGLMIKHMVMEHTNMQMEPHMLESGLKTNSTAKEQKLGPMERVTTGCTKTAKKMGKEPWLLQMAVFTQGNSLWMKFLDRAGMYGQTLKFMKASGRKIKCMAKESWNGRMENSTRVNSSTTREKAMEFSLGRTVVSTMASGVTASSMEEEFL